ncbi:hypothetical protein [Lysinibacillus sp. TE18511]
MRKKHLLAQAAHRTPPGSSALRESEASAQSAQPEWKSTLHYGNDPYFLINTL